MTDRQPTTEEGPQSGAAGIGLWLGVQALINIGVNMGLLPTKGLTLPFVSYGGSAMIGAMAAVGVLLGLNLWLGLLAMATWLLVAFVWRISSLSALVAAALAPLYSIGLLGFETAGTLAVSAMSLLLIWRHRSNIVNLLTGKEGRIGEKKTPE